MSTPYPAGPPPLPNSARIEEGDATGGLIPYKNPPALVAYYLGLFGLIPALGFILALAAVPLGIYGLKQRKQRPIIRGGGSCVGRNRLRIHIRALPWSNHRICDSRDEPKQPRLICFGFR
jgi:hypothetical protein